MTTWRMLIVFWIPEATQTLKYLLPFHCNSGCTNTPQVLRYNYTACLVAFDVARFAMNIKSVIEYS